MTNATFFQKLSKMDTPCLKLKIYLLKRIIYSTGQPSISIHPEKANLNVSRGYRIKQWPKMSHIQN